VEASQTWQYEYEAGARKDECATETKIEMECDVAQTKMEWSQRKMKLEFERNLYDGDWNAELDIEAETK